MIETKIVELNIIKKPSHLNMKALFIEYKLNLFFKFSVFIFKLINTTSCIY
jgi:hypothetical protein